MKEPWYMTDSGMLCGAAIQLITWFMLILLLFTILDVAGLLLGHLIGIVLAFCGIPAKWLLDE